MKTARLLPLLVFPALLAGCPKKDEPQKQQEPLTSGEALQALEEAALSTEAANLTNGTIEIATDFTIGDAVEAAAAEVRDFVESQLPCAEITLAEATLTIEYGVNPGNCTYNGHTYTGSHSVTVEKNDMSDVIVHHEWNELSNGKLSVTGFADVTWSFSDLSRNVLHELTWTRLSDGKQGVGSGDRTQTTLEGGISEGIRVDGFRAWEGDAGTWDLDIDNVEMRWIDPVPQAGSYTLETPFDKSLSMTFERVDANTIQVTVASGNRSFDFNVTATGISEA